MRMSPRTPETDQQYTKDLPGWGTRFLGYTRHIASQRRFRITAYAVGIPMLLAVLAGTVLYVRYSRLIDARLRDGLFRDSVNIYAAPLVVSVGDALTPAALIAELRTAAFAAGSYRLIDGGVKISPAGSSI